MIGRLSEAVGEGLNLLDQVNRAGLDRAIPALAEMVNNGDLNRMVKLARVYSSAEDALSDEMVGRLTETVGNGLSLYFPVKFHANLKRRDKLPFAASMLGVAAASVGGAPYGFLLRAAGKDGPTMFTLLGLVTCAVAGWVAWRLLLPVAIRLLVQRREIVLRAVTRD